MANALARKVTSQELKKLEKEKAGQIVHFAFGASMGALYGWLASTVPAVTFGAPGRFSARWCTTSVHTRSPMSIRTPVPLENGPAQEGVEFASHLVYRLVTDCFAACSASCLGNRDTVLCPLRSPAVGFLGRDDSWLRRLLRQKVFPEDPNLCVRMLVDCSSSPSGRRVSSYPPKVHGPVHFPPVRC